MPSILSESLRPKTLDEVVGQEHLLGKTALLRKIITEKKAISMLLWGPPGCGKTTVARIYAKALTPNAFYFSATNCSSQELKDLLKKRETHPLLYPYIVLFMDEIHRFNKSQQDFFLPYLENGSLILIAATTENPSFSLNNALLSRLRTFTFRGLESRELSQIIDSFEQKNPGLLKLTENAKKFLIEVSSGDGRYLLNMVENISVFTGPEAMDEEEVKNLLQKKAPLFDKSGEQHYGLISALHKSIRGSDPDAALYWLVRILQGGEDPLYIARRLIRTASEDIGLADPEALSITLNAYKTYQILGSPEGELTLAQAVIYLALSPKSNACYSAYKKSSLQAENSSHLPPPKHILNAPTSFMKKEGFGEGYRYDHDCPLQFSGQNYFPEDFSERPSFYQPNAIGFEREMVKRLQYFEELRKRIKNSPD